MAVDAIHPDPTASGAYFANDLNNFARTLANALNQAIAISGRMIHVSDGGANVLLGQRYGMSPADAAAVFVLITNFISSMQNTGTEPGIQIINRIG